MRGRVLQARMTSVHETLHICEQVMDDVYPNVIASRNLGEFHYVIALNKSCLLPCSLSTTYTHSSPPDYEQIARVSKHYILLASS